MSNKEEKRRFQKDGFIKLKGFFEPDELVHLKHYLSQARDKIEQESRLNQEGLIFHSNLFQHSQKLRNFIAQEKIAGLVEQLAHEKIWVRWDQTITKAPGGNPFPWHRDNVYNKLKAEHFQFWIALTPMNRTNGGLWLVKGSHKWPKLKHVKQNNHWEVKPDLLANEAEVVEAAPGDVVIFSSYMLHKTEVNNSDSDRTAFVIEFMKQTHFDPKIEAPYFFINKNKAELLKKHPSNKWYKSNSVSLLKDSKPNERLV